jgi:predicted nucleic acid-binding protein
MVTYVLDSSAISRYLDDEAGAARVSQILTSHLQGSCEATITAPHWGEIAGITCKKRGRRAMELVLARLSAFGMRVVAADAERSVRAVLIKLERDLRYVDAFGVELAAQTENCILVTADFDFEVASRDVKIEFLPAK